MFYLRAQTLRTVGKSAVEGGPLLGAGSVLGIQCRLGTRGGRGEEGQCPARGKAREIRPNSQRELHQAERPLEEARTSRSQAGWSSEEDLCEGRGVSGGSLRPFGKTETKGMFPHRPLLAVPTGIPRGCQVGRPGLCVPRQRVETKLQISMLTCPILTHGSPAVRRGLWVLRSASPLLHQ